MLFVVLPCAFVVMILGYLVYPLPIKHPILELALIVLATRLLEQPLSLLLPKRKHPFVDGAVGPHHFSFAVRSVGIVVVVAHAGPLRIVDCVTGVDRVVQELIVLDVINLLYIWRRRLRNIRQVSCLSIGL